MRVLAIDPSLSATGWALGTSHSLSTAPGIWKPHTLWTLGTVKTKPVRNRFSTLIRFDSIVEGIMAGIGKSIHEVDLVIIEGPAFSTNNGMAHERAGLWWRLFEHFAREVNVQTEVIGPTLRAKYATGRGNAGKDEVLAGALRRYPSAPITNNNEADAVVLAAMGARWLGKPIDDLPKTHTDAMKTLLAMVDLAARQENP